MPLPWQLTLYRVLTTLLSPLSGLLLAARARRGKEDPARLGERRGIASRARPQGEIAWVHGASVGETIALLPVIDGLCARGLTVVVTSGTRTSATLLARRLPAGALHQYVPLDVGRFVARFLEHWRPGIALFCESELWPNMVIETQRRGVPLGLVNARLSERSYRRWRRLRPAMEAMLERFSLCLAQSAGDAHRLADLGAHPVLVAGNLKFDVPAPPADHDALAALSGLVAGRPTWIAASTHPGEEEAVLAAHAAVAARIPTLLTIIMPRHPQRGERLADRAAGETLTVARRSLGEVPGKAVGIYIADTMGEAGLFYRLAPIAFVGGTLEPIGGHNPIEPAKLGAAILHGPHVANAADIYAALDKAGGALPVADGDALAKALGALLKDPARVRTMARAAAATVEGLAGAVPRTLRALDPYLPAAALPAPTHPAADEAR